MKYANAKAYLMWGKMDFFVSEKTFRILKDFSRKSGYQTEEDNTGCGKKAIPALKKQYIQAQDVTFSVPLDWSYAPVQKQIDKWQGMLGKESYMYQDGSPVGKNKFMLVEISESGVEWSGDGKKIRATLGLTFKETRSKKLTKKAAKKWKKKK